MSEKQAFLIIDDTFREVDPFIEILKNKGHNVDYREDPKIGIETANNQYSLIFIDLIFPYSDRDGTDIGIAIRKKCPLIPLVLLTANGKENIRDFIWVGFDDYFDKHPEGEHPKDKISRFLSCIEKAKCNSQRRIKSTFSQEELGNIKKRLDNIELAYSQSMARVKTIQRIANAVSRIEGLQKLSSQALSGMFQTMENGNLKIEALKARQLLIENPEKWKIIRNNFKPLKKLTTELIEYGFPTTT
jgi:CheY-like chemotaxis protein